MFQNVFYRATVYSRTGHYLVLVKTQQMFQKVIESNSPILHSLIADQDFYDTC